MVSLPAHTKCGKCNHDRKVCDRARPTCQRCHELSRPCTYVGVDAVAAYQGDTPLSGTEAIAYADKVYLEWLAIPGNMPTTRSMRAKGEGEGDDGKEKEVKKPTKKEIDEQKEINKQKKKEADEQKEIEKQKRKEADEKKKKDAADKKAWIEMRVLAEAALTAPIDEEGCALAKEYIATLGKGPTPLLDMSELKTVIFLCGPGPYYQQPGDSVYHESTDHVKTFGCKADVVVYFEGPDKDDPTSFTTLAFHSRAMAIRSGSFNRYLLTPNVKFRRQVDATIKVAGKDAFEVLLNFAYSRPADTLSILQKTDEQKALFKVIAPTARKLAIDLDMSKAVVAIDRAVKVLAWKEEDARKEMEKQKKKDAQKEKEAQKKQDVQKKQDAQKDKGKQKEQDAQGKAS